MSSEGHRLATHKTCQHHRQFHSDHYLIMRRPSNVDRAGKGIDEEPSLRESCNFQTSSTPSSRNTAINRCSHHSNYSNEPQAALVSPDIQIKQRKKCIASISIRSRVTLRTNQACYHSTKERTLPVEFKNQ